MEGKPNEHLVEIKDKELVKKIKEALNINYSELDDTAPFICGTISNGGFARKQKMIRADLFSLLSVC